MRLRTLVPAALAAAATLQVVAVAPARAVGGYSADTLARLGSALMGAAADTSLVAKDSTQLSPIEMQAVSQYAPDSAQLSQAYQARVAAADAISAETAISDAAAVADISAGATILLRSPAGWVPYAGGALAIGLALWGLYDHYYGMRPGLHPSAEDAPSWGLVPDPAVGPAGGCTLTGGTGEVSIDDWFAANAMGNPSINAPGTDWGEGHYGPQGWRDWDNYRRFVVHTQTVRQVNCLYPEPVRFRDVDENGNPSSGRTAPILGIGPAWNAGTIAANTAVLTAGTFYQIYTGPGLVGTNTGTFSWDQWGAHQTAQFEAVPLKKWPDYLKQATHNTGPGLSTSTPPNDAVQAMAKPWNKLAPPLTVSPTMPSGPVFYEDPAGGIKYRPNGPPADDPGIGTDTPTDDEGNPATAGTQTTPSAGTSTAPSATPTAAPSGTIVTSPSGNPTASPSASASPSPSPSPSPSSGPSDATVIAQVKTKFPFDWLGDIANLGSDQDLSYTAWKGQSYAGKSVEKTFSFNWLKPGFTAMFTIAGVGLVLLGVLWL